MCYELVKRVCWLNWQTFERWKADVDEKLKEEKRKKVRRERRTEEAKKEEHCRKREDAQSAYNNWFVLIVSLYTTVTVVTW